MTTLDSLWGGQLRHFSLDTVSHALKLEITMLDQGAEAGYLVRCDGVSDLRFSNAIPQPWTYAEVTEIHESRDRSGRSVLTFVLWPEQCELVITCDRFDMVLA